MSEAVHLTMLSPGGNWLDLASRIALGLTGYGGTLPAGSTVALVHADPGAGAVDAPRLVAEGSYDMAFTTPSWFARLACEGLAPFDAALPLRAIADFPHDDRMVFAARRALGATSLDELLAAGRALNISMPARDKSHPVIWAVDGILAECGTTLDALEAGGGRILDDRPSDMADPKGDVVDPGFDVVFDEAIMSPRWRLIAERHDVTFLPIEESTLRRLEARGWPRGEIAAGRFRGQDDAVPTVDFSGWLLFCRADLDNETAYATVAAIEAQKAAIERTFQGRRSLSGPVDMARAAAGPVTLHPGAERYYSEHGHLSS